MAKLSRARSCNAVTLGLFVLACRPAHGTSARPSDAPARVEPAAHGGAVEPGDPRPAAVDDAPPVEPATARIGPIRREAAFVFVPHPGAATLARLAKTLRAVTVGADLRVELGCPDGARVIEGKHGRKLALADESAAAAVVDPQAKWIAVALASGRVTVFARSQSKRIGTWIGRDPIAVASDMLVLRDECRWLALDPGEPTVAPRVLADDVCGEVLHVDRERRRISIAQTGADAAVRALVHVGGSEIERVELPGDPVMTSAAMSGDGEILCGLFAIAGKSVLQCRPTAGGAFEKIASGVLAPLRFAVDAPRLAFTARERGGVPELHVADFQQRFVRALGRVHQHRFAFLPGGDRIVAFEGGRGVVFQLDSGFVVPFGGREDDWVGVVALPGNPDAFLATRLRSRCADLVRVDLPATPG